MRNAYVCILDLVWQMNCKWPSMWVFFLFENFKFPFLREFYIHSLRRCVKRCSDYARPAYGRLCSLAQKRFYYKVFNLFIGMLCPPLNHAFKFSLAEKPNDYISLRFTYGENDSKFPQREMFIFDLMYCLDCYCISCCTG